MEATNLATLYGSPLLDWAAVATRLDAGLTQAPGAGGPDRHTCWLATIDREGSPHVTGVGALWVDGAFWFETGGATRKARNLGRDPRCTLSVATHDFDLVVEGEARRVTDRSTVAVMAAQWAAGGTPGRQRGGSHRGVQRPFGRSPALVRLPPHASHRHRRRHGGARRRNPLASLIEQ
jgi:hypothetical protein